MEITWYGLNCFRLTERGHATIVTDPYDIVWGYPPLKLRGDIVTMSREASSQSYLKSVQGVQRAVTGPGEYEIGGVFIIGAAMINKRSKEADVSRNVAYLFDFDGLSVLHLGNLDYVPSQSAVEKLGAVDIVLVPVGGNDALDSAQAAEVVSLFEPKIVIPMRYKTPRLGLDFAPVDKFLKERGVTAPLAQESLKVSRSNLPEQTQVVLLANRQDTA